MSIHLGRPLHSMLNHRRRRLSELRPGLNRDGLTYFASDWMAFCRDSPARGLAAIFTDDSGTSPAPAAKHTVSEVTRACYVIYLSRIIFGESNRFQNCPHNQLQVRAIVCDAVIIGQKPRSQSGKRLDVPTRLGAWRDGKLLPAKSCLTGSAAAPFSTARTRPTGLVRNAQKL